MVAPSGRKVCKCLEAMGNTMVQLGLIGILYGLGRNTLDKDLLRALWMAGEATVYISERESAG